MKRILFFIFLVFSINSNAQVWQQKFYMANNTVNAIAKKGNMVYIAGTFDYVGPNEGAYTVLDSATGNANSSFPKIYFYSKMIEDGSGGWYILGGTNLEIGGQVKNRLAHIYANGNLSTWSPNPNGNIVDLKVSGGKVYVAGTFDTIGGQRRPYMAALDTATGTATAWNPNIDKPITTLAVANNSVYVAGPFTFISGQVRGVLAAFDATTGQITSWDPSGGTVFSISNPDVKRLEANGNTIYVSGGFTSIGGQPRNGFAAIDATTSSITPWNPGSGVQDWIIKNNTMYVTGSFSTIGGQPRSGLAALDLITGSATSWNPTVAVNYATALNYIAVNGNTVYVAAGDPTFGGTMGRWTIAVDATTGATTSWNPFFENVNPSNYVYNGIYTLAAGGGKVFTSGNYHSVNGQTRNRIAALDATTGALANWYPQIIGTVSRFLATGNTLYVIGNFTAIDGQARKNAAAFDISTGLVKPWDPNPNNTITDIATNNGIVYLSGTFTNVGGQIRNYLAAVDSATGLATSWAPVVNTTVNVLKIAGNSLYVAGGFTTIGGQARNNLASFDLSTGAVSSWNPNPNGSVNAFASNSNSLFLLGNFSTFSGQARTRLAAIDFTTNAIKPWNPTITFNSSVFTMAANDTVVYIGGGTSISSPGGNGIFIPVDAVTGTVRPWSYIPNDAIRMSLSVWTGVSVNAIELDGNRIYMGGIFLRIGNYSSPCLAVFGDAPNPPLPLHTITLGVQERGNTALLNWQVDEEDNIVKYEVEKSSDGRTFVSIGTAVTNGTHQYQLTDAAPFNTNFYRVKAVSKSGTVIYSKIVKLNIQGKGEIRIYPNPVVNNELQLQLNNVKKGSYQVVIYNVGGQKLLQQMVIHEAGSQTITADVSKVPTGIHIVTLVDENGKVLYKERWVKM